MILTFQENPQKTVWTVEASQQGVSADSKTEFSLNSPETGVSEVSFEPWKYSTMAASGDEGLKEDSSDDDRELDGKLDFDFSKGFDVSQGMSLLAGSEEFENSENINKAVIEFRVSKAWIEENNIDISTIVLKRSHDGAWTSFSTVRTGEDEEYFFFGAEVRTSPGIQLWEQK